MTRGKQAVAIAIMVVIMGVPGVPLASAKPPFVSCRDGHLVPVLTMCPSVKRPTVGVTPGGSGGPRNGGGLLGTVGRVLGGLTGGLL